MYYSTRHYFEREFTIFPATLDILLFIGWTPCQETHDEIWLAGAVPAVTRIKIGYI